MEDPYGSDASDDSIIVNSDHFHPNTYENELEDDGPVPEEIPQLNVPHSLIIREASGISNNFSCLHLGNAILIVGSCNGKVRCWNAQTMKKVTLRGLIGRISCIDSRGTFILACTELGEIGLWTLTTPVAAVKIWKGHNDVVSCCVFGSEEKTFATGSWDRRVILWRASLDESDIWTVDGKECGKDIYIREKRRRLLSKEYITCLTFINESTLVAGSDDGSIKVIRWSEGEGRITHKFKLNDSALKAKLAGEALICVDVFSNLRYWNPETGETLHDVMFGDSTEITCCDFDENFYVIGRAGRMEIWSLKDPKELATIPHLINGELVAPIALIFIPETCRVVTLTEFRGVMSWDITAVIGQISNSE
eukprot:TRINITY_DN12191_c0_g1_i1.p1 TRINITY_DN12191_c0_g1~~TRINITY_DN12191_c0_g1_i1.p1  ORF type:complete len:365 (-),score=39.45 TRINITY_DN12191_c0_g1_i1:23-1117(-)